MAYTESGKMGFMDGDTGANTGNMVTLQKYVKNVTVIKEVTVFTQDNQPLSLGFISRITVYIFILHMEFLAMQFGIIS